MLGDLAELCGPELGGAVEEGRRLILATQHLGPETSGTRGGELAPG